MLEDEALVGIVTEADFLTLLVDRLTGQRAATWRDLPVNYYLSDPVVSLSADDRLERAAEILEREAISAVVVMDTGQMVGILTATDILAELAPPPAQAHGAGDQNRPLAGPPVSERVVGDVMTRGVVTVHAHDALPRAAAALLEHEVHRAVVVEGDRPIGLFSRSDCVPAVRDLGLTAPLSRYVTPLAFAVDVNEPRSTGLALLEHSDLHNVLVRDGGWPVGIFGQLEAISHRDAPLDQPVGLAMSASVICLAADLPLCRAAAQMSALGARLCVAQGQDGVQGVATATDFTRACAELA